MLSPAGPGADTAVVLDGVAKHFGPVQALCGLDARIHFGRLTGLVGPDGAGKTTLMRIMAGLLVPNAGRVTLAGFDTVLDNDAIHAASGYMPQRFGLYEDLSVMENLRLYARLRSLDADRHGALFDELLAFTRLGPFTARGRRHPPQCRSCWPLMWPDRYASQRRNHDLRCCRQPGRAPTRRWCSMASPSTSARCKPCAGSMRASTSDA